MQALTLKQQRFVLAMASDPFGTRADWARSAGYSDLGNNAAGIGHHLALDPKIQAASLEVAKACATTLGPHIAFGVLSEVARNANHRDRVRAAIALADRSGLAPIVKHEVSHTHTDLTGSALLEQIRILAERNGLDYQKLIGPNAIEGEFKVVGDVQGGTVSSGEGAAGVIGDHQALLPEGRPTPDPEGPGSG